MNNGDRENMACCLEGLELQLNEAVHILQGGAPHAWSKMTADSVPTDIQNVASRLVWFATVLRAGGFEKARAF